MSDIPLELRPDYIIGLAAGRLLPAMLESAPQAPSVPDGLADQNVKSSAGLLLPGKVDLWVAERYSPAPKPSVPDEVRKDAEEK